MQGDPRLIRQQDLDRRPLLGHQRQDELGELRFGLFDLRTLVEPHWPLIKRRNRALFAATELRDRQRTDLEPPQGIPSPTFPPTQSSTHRVPRST